MKVIVVCVAGLLVIVTLHRHMKTPPATDGKVEHDQKIHGRNSDHLGLLIWQDEFDFLDYNKWQHMITGWRGSQSFQVLTQFYLHIFKKYTK